MQQMVANQAFSTSDYFLLAVIKLAALVVAAASGFRGGRIFPAVFVGVALGLMLHEHVPAVPAAITVSCAILGIVLVVTRDGWLSLFMAAVVVPNTTLLPLLCIVMLPAWLLLAGKPMMMVNRPKQQPPHDNVCLLYTSIEYVRWVRMAKARMILQKYHLSIHEVAQRCGFPDSDYFCRVFRRQFGLTPGEYSARFQG